METASLILPVPLAVQVAPTVPAQVHVTLVSAVGKVSVTVALAVVVPVLVTVIV